MLPLALAASVVQVCNMKPVEIMSLLEEASGTRMYEKKKEKAMATMDKKDQKLQEIEVVLRTEIRPSVSRSHFGRGVTVGKAGLQLVGETDRGQGGVYACSELVLKRRFNLYRLRS